MAKIETEVLLAQAVEAELEKLAAEGGLELGSGLVLRGAVRGIDQCSALLGARYVVSTVAFSACRTVKVSRSAVLRSPRVGSGLFQLKPLQEQRN